MEPTSMSGSMTITLREAEFTDVRKMVELDRLCFPEEFRYDLGTFVALCGAPTTLALMAYHGNEDPVGFAISDSVKGRNGYGHLITIDVHPDFRERGIGSTLLKALEEWVKKKGLKKMLLEVYTANSRAICFYRSHGYQDITVLVDYYGPDQSGYLMVKELGKQKEL